MLMFSVQVVQLYISWSSTNETMPSYQLAGFQRYYVRASSSLEFKFNITPEQMAVWTDEQGFVVQPGKCHMMFLFSNMTQPSS